MAQRKKEKARIILPGQQELDERVREIAPQKKEKKVIYGPNGGVLASTYGDRWFTEEEMRRLRTTPSYEKVIGVKSVGDVRAYARDMQKRLVKSHTVEMMSLWSIIDDSLKVPLYLDKNKLGFPTEEVDFCRRYGFDDHLYPIAKDFVGKDESAYPKKVKGIMDDCGFKKAESVGKFISMAYPASKDHHVIDSTKRMFFAVFNPSFMEALKESEDPDKSLDNAKRILDQTDAKARPGLLIRLGEHPNSIKQLCRMGWHEGERIGEFFKKIVRNPDAFDVVVK